MHDIHHCNCACHNAVNIRNLTVELNDVKILDNVSIHIPRGVCTAIVGGNGAGKTTLTKAILGEIRYSGEVRFNGADGSAVSRPRLGYVPQKLQFDRAMPLTVMEFLAVSIARRPLFLGISNSCRKQIISILEDLECTHIARRRLGHISGGELQRVLLANALLQNPDILILDEPAAGVDFNGERLYCELLERFRKERGFTQLLVSHDLATVAAHAAHVVCLKHQVLAAGRPDEVFTPEILHAAFGRHIGTVEIAPHSEVCSCHKP